MKEYAALASGIVLAGLLAVANIQLSAVGCSKWCGAGAQEDFGTRAGDCPPGQPCAWVECTQERYEGCSGPYNDQCGSPDWCDATE